MTESGEQKAPWEGHEDPRMQAYYYGFTPTGDAAVDWVLHAVAVAGKGCHSTEFWSDAGDAGYLASHGLRGDSYAEAIQNAAEDAAKYRGSDTRAGGAHEKVVLAVVDGHEDAWCAKCAQPYEKAHPEEQR